MSLPQIVSPEHWLSARKALLAKEKAATRARDALNAERRRLPMVTPRWGARSSGRSPRTGWAPDTRPDRTSRNECRPARRARAQPRAVPSLADLSTGRNVCSSTRGKSLVGANASTTTSALWP